MAEPTKSESVRRVIVFCLPGIGDTVMFTPALALLRRMFPQAHITAITMFRGTEHILATNPDLNEVRHFDFFNASAWENLRYLWRLRCEGYDLSIMSFPSNRLEYNIANWFVGRRWRAAHRYHRQSWRNLWFLNNIVVRETGRHHNAEENLRLLAAIATKLGLHLELPPWDVERTERIRQCPLKLAIKPDDEAAAKTFLAEHNLGSDKLLIGIHTWSSTYKNMAHKCWDKDNFVALIRRLGDERPEARFLLVTGPADEEINQYILQQADSRVVLVREANLRRAVAILSHCRVFISNDSGVMHLAAAAAVPVVALFGPTDWWRLHPWTERHAVVSRELPCSPCFYYSSRALRCVENVDYACIRKITVDEVHTAVNQLLSAP
ncbi:MAG: glycosyltransferase family 9 protein [Verrucomicrobia bacterium]|nr:glycosyltransferase family 9 protein [Verrucomicrobiota bacterium]